VFSVVRLSVLCKSVVRVIGGIVELMFEDVVEVSVSTAGELAVDE